LLPRKAFAAGGTGPQRLVIFYTQNGCLTNRWFPKTASETATVDAAAGATQNVLYFPPGKYKVALTVALPPKKAGDPMAPLPPYKPDTVYDLTKSQTLDIEVPGK
jgi:hypothetical protein